MQVDLIFLDEQEALRQLARMSRVLQPLMPGIEIKPLAASDAFAGGHVVFSLAVSGGAIDRRAITITANSANALCRRG